MEAELFAATALALCTVWPRIVMRGALRKENSGSNSVPKSVRRTELSSRNPRFAARPKGVAVQRRVWGSQEGAREPYGALAPFCLRRQTAAFPPVNTGISGRRGRPIPPLPWERHLRHQTAASSQNRSAGSGSTQIPRVFFNFPCLQLTFSIFHGILNYRK